MTSIYQRILNEVAEEHVTRQERENISTIRHFLEHPECLHPIIGMDADANVIRDKTRVIDIRSRLRADWFDCVARENAELKSTDDKNYWVVPTEVQLGRTLKQDEMSNTKVIEERRFLDSWLQMLKDGTDNQKKVFFNTRSLKNRAETGVL
jgi:hypothetical protein